MTKDSDKDIKGVASEAFSRAERSARSDKPVQDHELAWYSPSEAALTRTDEKLRTIEEREREMVALARAHILTCGDFLLVQDLANQLGIHYDASFAIDETHFMTLNASFAPALTTARARCAPGIVAGRLGKGAEPIGAGH